MGLPRLHPISFQRVGLSRGKVSELRSCIRTSGLGAVEMARSPGGAGNGNSKHFTGWKLGDFWIVRTGSPISFYLFIYLFFFFLSLFKNSLFQLLQTAPEGNNSGASQDHRTVPGTQQVLHKFVLNGRMKLRQRSTIIHRIGKSGIHESTNTKERLARDELR